MPHHPPFVIGNDSHVLDHLDPVTFATPSTKLGRDIRTRCWFTTHVFTRKTPSGYPGPTRLDEGKRPRVFCPDRYALSHHLPAAVGLLTDPDRYVWEGAHERNWVHRVDVDVPRPVGGSLGYQLFFAMRKAPRAEAYDVEMVVESAYAYDPLRLPKVGGRMKIAGLLTGTIEGKRPHAKRRA